MNVGGPGADDGARSASTASGTPRAWAPTRSAASSSTCPAGCTAFSSDVGVDDSRAGKGSVTFSVLADGAQVASTGVIGRSARPAPHGDVTGAQRLTLNVGDAGDGIGHDNGDWAGAQLDGVHRLTTGPGRRLTARPARRGPRAAAPAGAR